MRVLHIYAGNLYGGVERLLVTLARLRGLCPEMEPHFSLCYDARLAAELRAAGNPPHIAGPVRFSRPWTVWRARARIHRSIREIRPDVVFAHEFWPYALGAPVVKRLGLPIAIWHHSPTSGYYFEKYVRRHPPDLIGACSHYVARSFARLYGLAASGACVLRAPVTAPSPRNMTARIELRRRLHTRDGEVVILYAGRLSPYKGLRQIILAMQQLKPEPVRLWVAGGAQQPAEHDFLQGLHEECQASGISDRVHFLGHVNETEALYAAADIFCQPNVSPEPYGLNFIEALYSGLPVVSSDHGGAAEILRVSPDDMYGVLVPPGDVGQLAEALRALIREPARRQQLAERGPARARELADPTTTIAEIARQAKRLLSVRGMTVGA